MSARPRAKHGLIAICSFGIGDADIAFARASKAYGIPVRGCVPKASPSWNCAIPQEEAAQWGITEHPRSSDWGVRDIVNTSDADVVVILMPRIMGAIAPVCEKRIMPLAEWAMGNYPSEKHLIVHEHHGVPALCGTNSDRTLLILPLDRDVQTFAVNKKCQRETATGILNAPKLTTGTKRVMFVGPTESDVPGVTDAAEQFLRGVLELLGHELV